MSLINDALKRATQAQPSTKPAPELVRPILKKLTIVGKFNVFLSGLTIGAKFKERASLVIYAVAIGLTFVNPWIGFALYSLVALVWLVPDRRIEQALGR